MGTLRRGLSLGAAFGLAAAVLDLTLRFLMVTQQRIAPGPGTLARAALVHVALGALLGLAGSPLLRARRAPRASFLAHLAWLAAAWLALETWLAVDSPLLSRGMYARPLGAALFLLTAAWAGTRWRPARTGAWGLGLVLLAGLSVAPSVYVAATSAPPTTGAALPPARAGAPDVVLIVLDTVRAQSLSAYGYARDTSPTLAALAAEGALFLDATSPATWSLPAHASLFTGRLPTSHGAHTFGVPLDGRFPTLAEVLAANGYETACFTANGWISDALGLTRGFARQDLAWQTKGGLAGLDQRLLDRLGLGAQDKGGAQVTANFEKWTRARPPDAPPSFAFLNLIEAHFPHHQLPAAYRDRYTDLPLGALRRVSLAVLGQQFGGPDPDVARDGPIVRDLYDGGIAYTDHLLRRVVEAIRARDALDRTLLVVLADHGEILGEHGRFFGHGPSLYQRMISVPLVLRYPPRVPAGVHVATPVSTLGAFATILDLAEIDPPPTLQGGSLAPLLRPAGAEGAAAGPVLSENVALAGASARRSRDDPQMIAGKHLRALRSGSWKLVESSDGRTFLYDLAADPGEARDLAAERPDVLAALHGELERERTRLGLPRLAELGASAAAAELDAQTRANLEALGYVEDTPNERGEAPPR